MANEREDKKPDGLTPETQEQAGEAASEQGWGLNEEKRTETPKGPHPEYGGKDYNYGAQDFGDTPSHAEADAERDVNEREQKKKAS